MLHKDQQLTEQKDILLTSSVETLHLSVSNFRLAFLSGHLSIYLSRYPLSVQLSFSSCTYPSLSSHLAPSLCLPNCLSLHPSCPIWICPSVLSCLSVCWFVFSLSFKCLCSSESDLKLNSCLWKMVKNCCCGRPGKLSSCFTSKTLKQWSITSQRVFCPDRWWEEITLTSLIGVCAEVKGGVFQEESTNLLLLFSSQTLEKLCLDLPSWLKWVFKYWVAIFVIPVY